MAEKSIPDVGVTGAPTAAEWARLEEAWILGERCRLKYDAIAGDPTDATGIASNADDSDTTPAGYLATLISFSSDNMHPRSEQAQMGSRRFSHGVPLGTITCRFNATVNLLKWVKARNTRVNRRLPIGTFAFECYDNAGTKYEVEFPGKLERRRLTPPITTEGSPADLEITILVTDDDGPAP